jgi:hypothetical protein
MATLGGRCYCRKLRFSVEGPVRNLCVCHCESCRRAAGATFVAWGTVDDGCFHVLSGTLSLIRTTPEVQRGFCDTCGTSLTYRHFRRSGEVDFTLVSLDDPTLLQPQAHIWVRDKLPWTEIADGLPQYQTVPPDADA